MLLGSASSYWLVVKVSKFMDTHLLNGTVSMYEGTISIIGTMQHTSEYTCTNYDR